MTLRPLTSPEPWMRGTHTDVPVASRAVIHALELAQEEIARWCESLHAEEIFVRPFDLPSVSFQLKHIARSVDRILCYAEGHALSEAHLAALKSEQSRDASLSELLAEVEASLEQAKVRVRALAAGDLDAPRGVGRKQLPTTVGGAMIHVAEHTQRHIGQLIATVKVLRGLRH